MATIRKKGEYQFHVQIRKKGYAPVTRTFISHKSATEFARHTETQMDKGTYQELSDSSATIIATLAKKYLEELPADKKNIVEDKRLMSVVVKKFGKVYLSNLKTMMIKEWIDDLKKKKLASSTINHHLSALSTLIDTAIKDWGYVLPGNPCSSVKRMQSDKARDRRFFEGEEDRLIEQCRLSGNKELLPAVKLSILTAMRQGELFKLEWENIDFNKQTALLIDTKNGEDRKIPLFDEAITILNEIKSDRKGKIFKTSQHGVASSLRNALDRARDKYLDDCKSTATAPQKGYLEDLHMHDFRHEATSRFFELGLNVMEVASITGHKSLSMLQRYTHLKAENLVAKINKKN